MKRKALVLLLSGLVFLSACGQTPAGEDASESLDIADYDVLELVESVAYKGLYVPEEDASLSDGEFELGLAEFLRERATAVAVTDRATAEGDTINLSYETFCGGEAVSDFRAASASLTLGSGETFAEFESALVGRSCGEAFDVETVLPEALSEEFGGQNVRISVYINYIHELQIPELTDAFVQNLAAWNCATADEFRTVYREYLSQYKLQYYQNERENALWGLVLDGSEFTSAGQSYINASVEKALNDCRYVSENAGLSLDEFAVQNGYADENALLSAVEESAAQQAKTVIIMNYLAEVEGVGYSEDEYYEAVDNYAVYLGYGSTADMISAVGLESIEPTVRDGLLFSAAKAFAAENAATEGSE